MPDRDRDSDPPLPEQDRAPGLETDPRFPSGPWKGFWLQTHMGRQWMSLRFVFKDGKVSGQGDDVIGRFIFSGHYDLSNGRCDLIKTYLGSHDVTYRGQNDDDGLWLWGVWELDDRGGGERGGFHLWPAWEQDPTGQNLHAETDVPASAENSEEVRIKLPVGA